jgi:voltage-gated potassium channel
MTPFGQALAAMVMIMGYGIIAVPTGIVTVELAQQARQEPRAIATRRCSGCGHREADAAASFCRYCGEPLGDATT